MPLLTANVSVNIILPIFMARYITVDSELSPVKVCSCGTVILTKSNYCNYCARKANIKSRELRREKGESTYDLHNYKWRTNNPEKYILQSAKSRAKARGVAFNIDLEDIKIPNTCPVFGINIIIQVGNGASDNSPSLDRIDSSKGYVKGNVQVISWKANRLKSNGSLEEFKSLVEFLENAKKGTI